MQYEAQGEKEEGLPLRKKYPKCKVELASRQLEQQPGHGDFRSGRAWAVRGVH